MKKILKLLVDYPFNILGILYRDYLTYKNEYLPFCIYDNKLYYITDNEDTIILGDYIFIGNDLDVLK